MPHLRWIVAALATAVIGCSPMTDEPHISIVLLNQEGALVSQVMAERLAQVVVEEKYPRNIFVAKHPIEVLDQGEEWLVTIRNDLISDQDRSLVPMANGEIVPRKLVVRIRKSNGEFLSIA